MISKMVFGFEMKSFQFFCTFVFIVLWSPKVFIVIYLEAQSFYGFITSFR